MATHTAREIADWFLVWGEQNEAAMSNLKLQKLLYYAQGHHLGSHGVPIFDDKVEAWAHGPVVRSVYHELKKFGNADIDVDEAVAEDFDWDDYRDVEADLVRVWNTYGKYEAWVLRNRTHRESPWKDTFEDGERYLVIPQDAMREFFASS